ncbi:MAG TPA: hypothetical protein VIL71_17995 [Spirillospora sp.]
MRLRISAALPLALTLTLTLTGCGDDGGTGVASAGGAKKGAAESGEPDRHEKALKFAQCMREHGVDMEDPKPGEGVQIKIRGNKAEREKGEKALEACRKYSPEADASGPPDPRMQERAREFAECMRENGVKDFPDPDPNQRGIRIERKAGDDDATFDRAQELCQKKVFRGGK